jgi:hypothetical protein
VVEVLGRTGHLLVLLTFFWQRLTIQCLDLNFFTPKIANLGQFAGMAGKGEVTWGIDS